MALTRGAFGTRGSLLPVGANVVILMGWSWVQAMLAGITVNYLVEQATGFSNPILFSMLCQAVVVGLAIFGHEGIAKVEPWLALAILLAMAWVLTKAFTTFGIGDFTSIPVDPEVGLSAIVVLDIVIATAISWTVLSADINRLAKDTPSGVIGSISGYTLSTVAAMALGATAIGYVILSGAEALPFDTPTVVGAFGVPLAVVIVLSVTATNTMVVYGMVNSVINASGRWTIRFLPAALVLGAISILGTVWQDLLYSFTDFLVMIGAFFVPVFAIMIVDYYLGEEGRLHLRRPPRHRRPLLVLRRGQPGRDLRVGHRCRHLLCPHLRRRQPGRCDHPGVRRRLRPLPRLGHDRRPRDRSPRGAAAPGGRAGRRDPGRS